MSAPPAKKFCSQTDFTQHYFEYEWSVNNLLAVVDTMQSKERFNAFITSPTFSAPGVPQYQFILRLYPNDGDEKSKKFMRLYLLTSKRYYNALDMVTFHFSVLDCENLTPNSDLTEYIFPIHMGWSEVNFRKQEMPFKDNFTVLCKMTVFVDKASAKSSLKSMGQLAVHELTTDLAIWMQDYTSADVVFTVCGSEFKGHKIFLSIRSLVFSAMFSEKGENRINITDIQAKVFGELLRFLYTGTVSSLEALTGDLLVAADKYQVEVLKLLCAQRIADQLDVDSVADTVSLADMYKLEELKQRCIDFIASNYKKVFATKSWKEMVKTRPELVVQVVQDALDKK